MLGRGKELRIDTAKLFYSIYCILNLTYKIKKNVFKTNCLIVISFQSFIQKKIFRFLQIYILK